MQSNSLLLQILVHIGSDCHSKVVSAAKVADSSRTNNSTSSFSTAHGAVPSIFVSVFAMCDATCSNLESTSPGESCRQTRLKIGSRHCVAAFSLQVPNSCTDFDETLLYISILTTYSTFVRKNEMLALGVCFPQQCPSTGHRFAASRSSVDYCRTIRSFPPNTI